MNKKILIVILLMISSLFVFAQTDNTVARPAKAKSKYDKMFDEVKYGDNVYQQGSNWFTAAGGMSYCTNSNLWFRNFSLAYHHRFRAMYFRGGWHYAGEKFFFKHKDKEVRAMQQVNDFHIGAGLRLEDRWYNFGFFIGPAWTIAWKQDPAYPSGTVSKIYNTIGAHVEIQATFKIFYDMGLGLSLYGSFNKHYQTIGLQAHLYFSTAFKYKY